MDPGTRTKKMKRSLPLIEEVQTFSSPEEDDVAFETIQEDGRTNDSPAMVRRPPLCSRLLSVVAFIAFFGGIIIPIDAAHSRRRVVISGASEASSRSRYDRSITTFDPTGRLNQIEYSLQATKSKQTKNVLAVMITNEKNLAKEMDATSATDDATGIYLVIERGSTSSASASASASPPSCHYKVHRLDHDCYMVTTGLVGDGELLVRTVRQYCQQNKIMSGDSQSLMLSDVAQYCAQSIQHALTRTGGARPLACTVLIIGCDGGGGGVNAQTDKDDKDKIGRGHGLRIYRCQPGGTIEDCRYCAAGRDQGILMERMFRNDKDNLGSQSIGGDNETIETKDSRKASGPYEQLLQLQHPNVDLQKQEEHTSVPRPCVPAMIASKLVGMMSRVIQQGSGRPHRNDSEKRAGDEDDDKNTDTDDINYMDVWVFRPTSSLSANGTRAPQHGLFSRRHRSGRGGRSNLDTTCFLNVPFRIHDDNDNESQERKITDSLARSL